MIRKQIEKEINVKVFLHEYIVQCDSEKLIKKIDHLISQNNLNYATNVKGKMTVWHAFDNDPDFLQAMAQGMQKVTEAGNFQRMNLHEAWGLRHDTNDFTQEHDHIASPISGVLYLSEKNTPLIFPDLNLEVYPEKNSLVLFRGILRHSSPVNTSNDSKYAIAFNFIQFKDDAFRGIAKK